MDSKETAKPRHGVHHGKDRPVFAKTRRLDLDKLHTAKAEFSHLEAAGIIRRSDSLWSSPLHIVLKKDGTWRHLATLQ